MNDPRLQVACTRCGARIEDLSQPCPACGAWPSSQSQLPTVAASEPRPSSPFGTARTGRGDPSRLSRGEFTPGQVLAGRYQIIGLLGRGGMGEVYRADDLNLEQAVAIKLLPRSLSAVPGALDRFRAEVRNARQVAHPNVCRVYDIGEAEGVTFLTMEYVDGEDLATLLHRIGSLPPGKANEVASQLCAGLAAAHDKGVLHRDLKPSNVMIDGEGRVRITDFGLAVRMEDGAADFAGTPAYMAPEQFEGGPITVRTDLYSLGLILYEIYTGRRPFEATSVADWRSHHTQSIPAPPSGPEVPLNESVQRAILRCIEKDPTRRPASVRQLAAALPGGDPLAAALAAGETPSPEMVAEAGGEGALAPRTAWLLAFGLLATLAALIALSPYSEDLGLAPMRSSPEALRDHASELLDHFGYGRDVLDRGSWMERIYPPLLYIAKHTPSTQWRAHWRLGPPLYMAVRQSPRWMMAANFGGLLGSDDPPMNVSDMTLVGIGATGRLLYLRAVPPQVDTATVRRAFDWSELFKASELDVTRFQPVTPTRVPPDASDARAEWVGTIPELPGVPLRVAAAAYAGRPTYFEILGPWSRPERMERIPVTLTQRISGYTAGVIIVVSILMALLLIRRNRQLRRGDPRGAVRLGTLLFGLSMFVWLAGAHHVPSAVPEFGSFVAACAASLLSGASVAAMYLAIEPYVRRRMPELLIGWARLLEGRIRDPRIGRDVLMGAVMGGVSALLLHASNALPTWLPILGQTTVPPVMQVMQGGRPMLGFLATLTSNALAGGLTLTLVLFVLRLLLRRERLSLVALTLVLTLAQLGGENSWLEIPFAVLQAVMMTWAIGRVGLLGGAAMVFYRVAFSSLPLPVNAAAPYVAATLLMVGVMLALAAYALRISIGTRPLFSVAALDE